MTGGNITHSSSCITRLSYIRKLSTYRYLESFRDIGSSLGVPDDEAHAQQQPPHLDQRTEGHMNYSI